MKKTITFIIILTILVSCRTTKHGCGYTETKPINDSDLIAKTK